MNVMKKRTVLLIFTVILIIVGAVIYFSSFKILSTDKKIYSQEEPVKITYAIFRWMLSSWDKQYADIFRKEGEDLIKLNAVYQIDPGYNPEKLLCVNDSLMNASELCEILGCEFTGGGIGWHDFQPHIDSKTYTWKQTVYEERGLTEFCSGVNLTQVFDTTTGRNLTRIIDIKISKVPKGVYKIKYEESENIFEIV
jgi:uncharacterized protein (UPF0333 family)